MERQNSQDKIDQEQNTNDQEINDFSTLWLQGHKDQRYNQESSNLINVSEDKKPDFYIALIKKQFETHETIQLHSLAQAQETCLIAAESLVRDNLASFKQIKTQTICDVKAGKNVNQSQKKRTQKQKYKRDQSQIESAVEDLSNINQQLEFKAKFIVILQRNNSLIKKADSRFTKQFRDSKYLWFEVFNMLEINDIAKLQSVDRRLKNVLVKEFLNWTERRKSLYQGLNYWKYQFTPVLFSDTHMLYKLGQNLMYQRVCPMIENVELKEKEISQNHKQLEICWDKLRISDQTHSKEERMKIFKEMDYLAKSQMGQFKYEYNSKFNDYTVCRLQSQKQIYVCRGREAYLIDIESGSVNKQPRTLAYCVTAVKNKSTQILNLEDNQKAISIQAPDTSVVGTLRDVSLITVEDRYLYLFGASLRNQAENQMYPQYHKLSIQRLDTSSQYEVVSIDDVKGLGIGCLMGFEGNKSKFNDLKVKILTKPKDGRQQIEIIEVESHFFGTKFNVLIENIKKLEGYRECLEWQTLDVQHDFKLETDFHIVQINNTADGQPRFQLFQFFSDYPYVWLEQAIIEINGKTANSTKFQRKKLMKYNEQIQRQFRYKAGLLTFRINTFSNKFQQYNILNMPQKISENLICIYGQSSLIVYDIEFEQLIFLSNKHAQKYICFEKTQEHIKKIAQQQQTEDIDKFDDLEKEFKQNANLSFLLLQKLKISKRKSDDLEKTRKVS